MLLLLNRNHGITLIETGPDSSISIFDGKDLTGNSYTIGPGQTVLLDDKDIVDEDGDKTGSNWNDKTLSLITISGLSKAAEPLPTAYVVPQVGLALQPGPNCAILYGSDPVQVPTTTGIIVCKGTSSNLLTRTYLASKGIVLDDYAQGTSYVRTGSACTVTLYTSSTPDDSAHKLVIGPGKDADLLDYPIPNNPTVTWDDIPQSKKKLILSIFTYFS